MKKGTSSSNSLGLGLYQLSINDFINLNVFTSKKLNGSIFLIIPKNYNPKVVYFSLNYMDIKLSGDFVFKKGKFFLIGDVSGHGVKAHKSSELIKKFFFSNPFSCILVDDFFKKLHNLLKWHSLRSVVLSIVEYTRKTVTICGMGNIGVFTKHFNSLEFFEQKSGILGENYDSYSKIKLEVDTNVIVGLFTDGIDKSVIYDIETDNIILFAICAVYFSKTNDDKTILIIKGE